MEEMFLSKLSLENITAHLYSCPGCGCDNFCKITSNPPVLVIYGSNLRDRL